MQLHASLDIVPVLATFEAQGKRYEIRQLVTGTLVTRELSGDEFTPWPVGFSVERIRADFEKADRQANGVGRRQNGME